MNRFVILFILFAAFFTSATALAETRAEAWNSMSRRDKVMMVAGYINGLSAAQEITATVRDGGYEADERTLQLTDFFLELVAETLSTGDQTIVDWIAMMDAAYTLPDFEDTAIGYVLFFLAMEEAGRSLQ